MNKFGFETILLGLSRSTIPELIGDKAQEIFKQSFDDEGFNGNKWEEVKRREPGTFEYKYGTKASQTNPILTDTTQLRKSIKVIKADWDSVIVGTVGDANRYAEYHNEGTDKIPQREFIGHSSKLDREVERIIEKELDKLFKI